MGPYSDSWDDRWGDGWDDGWGLPTVVSFGKWLTAGGMLPEDDAMPSLSNKAPVQDVAPWERAGMLLLTEELVDRIAAAQAFPGVADLEGPAEKWGGVDLDVLSPIPHEGGLRIARELTPWWVRHAAIVYGDEVCPVCTRAFFFSTSVSAAVGVDDADDATPKVSGAPPGDGFAVQLLSPHRGAGRVFYKMHRNHPPDQPWKGLRRQDEEVFDYFLAYARSALKGLNGRTFR